MLWDSVENGAYYKLQVAKDPEFVKKVVKTGIIYELMFDFPMFFSKKIIPDGVYYWRVRAFNINGIKGPWSKAWKIKVDTKPPAIPVLYRPGKNASKSDVTPVFSVFPASGAKYYQYQIADDTEFSSIAAESDKKAGITWTVPVDSALKYGVYYWRVKSIDAATNESVDWSSVRRITITILKNPVEGAVISDRTPTFEWVAVDGADHYQLEITSEDPLGGEPGSYYFVQNGLIGSRYTLLKEDKLPAGKYWWRMRIFFDEDEIVNQATPWRLLKILP